MLSRNLSFKISTTYMYMNLLLMEITMKVQSFILNLNLTDHNNRSIPKMTPKEINAIQWDTEQERLLAFALFTPIEKFDIEQMQTASGILQNNLLIERFKSYLDHRKVRYGNAEIGGVFPFQTTYYTYIRRDSYEQNVSDWRALYVRSVYKLKAINENRVAQGKPTFTKISLGDRP